MPWKIAAMSIRFSAPSGTVAYTRQRLTGLSEASVFALVPVPGAIGGALLVGHASRALFVPSA